ncbi:hypothetical protein [Rhizobium sp. G21]|uniref:hypothetical protein n=1 Tax=Rhizobium sp. G21 TaxID=2758439 RepID=UPI0015FF84CC|nr:hypothetical protein [Rhizobium sp. G21]MBB1248808.1 hypothetical protein [Rhizobium sp. G21]
MATSAAAHSSEGGLVLLLPTGYFILAGVLAVAATFLILALAPAAPMRMLHENRLWLGPLPGFSSVVPSLLSFALLAFMVTCGFFGSVDPAHNPLPAFVWTVFWVCLVFAHGVAGRLWSFVNPWTGPLAVVRSLSKDRAIEGRFTLPARLGYAIAILQFSAFAWFELVYLYPEDPRRLAMAVSAYWLVNALGFFLFGARQWGGRAEPFGIFFDLIGRLAPFGWERRAGRLRLYFAWPGLQLVRRDAMSPSGVLFVLLTLSTVSFDGLSSTFVWLTAIGVNPLEFPGRSEVTLSSSFGLIVTFLALAPAYFGSIALGCLAAGERRFGEVAGRLIFSILPISLGFQAAHYLTLAMVGLQDFIVAASDPFHRGWDLFGVSDYQVSTSFLNVYSTVRMIFVAQTLAVTLGHVVAVILAHALLDAIARDRRKTLLIETPFALLMIAYTGFGLWLLSTARI